MTQQLARGARQALNRVEDEIADARDALDLLMSHTHDPKYVEERGEEIYEALARLEKKLEREIEPLLVRREPTLETRINELEERIRALEDIRRIL